MSYNAVAKDLIDYCREKSIPGKVVSIAIHHVVCGFCEKGYYFYGWSQPQTIKWLKDEAEWKDTRKGLTCPDCVKKKSL